MKCKICNCKMITYPILGSNYSYYCSLSNHYMIGKNVLGDDLERIWVYDYSIGNITKKTSKEEACIITKNHKVLMELKCHFPLLSEEKMLEKIKALIPFV